MRKKLHCLPYCKFQPPVLFFRAVYPLFFGGFSPCVRLSRGRWDTYPTPERKAAHRGDSGFCCFLQWRCVLLQKCISSYKPRFPKYRNDFSDFVPVPQKKQTSIAVTLPGQLCDGCDFYKYPTAATAFAVLLHLRHIFIRRQHPGCVPPFPGTERSPASACYLHAEGGCFAWCRVQSALPQPTLS